MRLNVEILGDEKQPSQVLYEAVEAGHLDPLMLVYDEVSDEVDAVAGLPEAFVQEVNGRPERWVRVRLADVEDPLEQPATSMQLIVYGADPNDLRPMLDPDLLTFAQEALAHNGLCSHLVDDEDTQAGAEQDDVPVYCGLPSDPDSDYRFCTGHDQARLDQSARLTGRYFAPTYGPIPVPAS
jgi:hypothetical protein